MSSIVFTAPRHLDPDVVKSFAPGVLFVHGRPQLLETGDYVYVCHRNEILMRALWKETVWWDQKITAEGEDRGPGWVLVVDAPEFPNRRIEFRGTQGFRYLDDGELW